MSCRVSNKSLVIYERRNRLIAMLFYYLYYISRRILASKNNEVRLTSWGPKCSLQRHLFRLKLYNYTSKIFVPVWSDTKVRRSL